jgi:spore coat polysaccharide biosynthesis protein SpsF
MTAGIIIQARMSSSRLPGKVLKNVCGKPMLAYLLERLSHCKNTSEIVVATSNDRSDQPIADFCSVLKVACFRGSLANVAKRIHDALSCYGFDVFVRISGDSPLLDQRLVDTGLNLFLNGECDMVTNILPRTFPKGQSVEILNSDVFAQAFYKMIDQQDLEHVTPYFYRNSEHYRIRNFESEIQSGHIQLSVDTDEDFLNFERIIKAMDRDHWHYDYKSLLELTLK